MFQCYSLKSINALLFNFYLFIVAARILTGLPGLSLAAVGRSCSSWQGTGFSFQWLLLLRSTGSRCAGFSSCGFQALQLSSCSTRAQLLPWHVESSQTRDQAPVTCIGKQLLSTLAPGKSLCNFEVQLLHNEQSLLYSGNIYIGYHHVLDYSGCQDAKLRDTWYLPPRILEARMG